MELTGRMADGSIPYDVRDAVPQPGPALPPLRQDQKVEYLRRVPIFEGCSERQLRAVARIARVLETPAGQVFARAGEPGNEFFLIVDGAVRAEISSSNQHRLSPGEFFGEMSLLDGEPRSATVVADTAVRLLVIDRHDFWKLLKEVPAFTEKLLVTLCQRVRHAESRTS